ncbi:MAG: hypothetical protein K8T91_01155 [Planctomycetes bacterium]|nr:hypothetical protein [Planctomycetota bacterium]
MLEQSGPSEIAPRYCPIAEAGRPVAAMASQMVVLEGGQLIAHAPEKGEEVKSKKLSAAPKETTESKAEFAEAHLPK